MRKLLLLFIALILTISLLSSCGDVETYDDGFEDGYDMGYSDALFEYEDDYARGYEDGYNDGFDRQDYDYESSYDDGYEAGHSDGYYDGATYTCLFFGDVDRAFQCANNGCSWFTFLDAYDQYISNIFDDDDTRSALFWSLISVTLGDDATKEEIDLLISTFGSNLFTRNGVELIEGS
jgi:hypothetical protein